MSLPPPRHSLSLPTSTSDSNEQVLPTPSSSTTVRNTLQDTRLAEIHDLEQQLEEKKKQLKRTTSGIGKNVLIRQMNFLEEQIKDLENTKKDPPTDRLRKLERDLTDYRNPLSMRNKKESFGQRTGPLTTGLEVYPSPTQSSILSTHQESTSILPSPIQPSPPPTKRRSKVHNTDRRNTDIEFATEIGQGLLAEVRKMQVILQEKEEQLRNLENQKADLERAAEAMTKQMRQREENEEKLKDESWNLELAKQELTVSVTDLQQNLNKANAEQSKLSKQADELRTEIEQLKESEEQLKSKIEAMKDRHEQDMSSMRQHTAVLQKEKTDQAKKIENLTSELAIAMAQRMVAPKLDSTDPVPSETLAQTAPVVQKESITSPLSSPKQLPLKKQNLEAETLKTSLAHAHRIISNLRANLHKEKTEKFELKKMLAESQETIEQIQNDSSLWVDETPSKRSQKTPRRRAKKSERRPRPSLLPPASYLDSTDGSSLSDDQEDQTPVPYIDPAHIGFTSLSSELSRSQSRSTAVDAQVNTDHVNIVPENSTSSDLAGGVLASDSIAISSELYDKHGIEISTQTEIEPVGTSVQTEAIPSVSLSTQTEIMPSTSLSTQTEISDSAIETSIQTEDKPNSIESVVQTDDKPNGIESFVQTDDKPNGIESVIQTDAKPNGIESVDQKDFAVVLECAEVEGPRKNHNKRLISAMEEVKDKKVLVPIEHLQDAARKNKKTAETSIEDDDELFNQNNESTDTVKPIKLQHNDAEIQTNVAETKDAEVQYDPSMFERPSVLHLMGSDRFSDENQSFYYDAASDINQSKPSSRNNLDDLASLDNSRQNIPKLSSNLRKLSYPKRNFSVRDIETKKDSDHDSLEELTEVGDTSLKIEAPDSVIHIPESLKIYQVIKEKDTDSIPSDFKDDEDYGSVIVHRDPENDEKDDLEQEQKDIIPERPTSPPPSSLMSRAMSPRGIYKGKMPDSDTEYMRSLNRTPLSASSMSTANTHDQLHSINSSNYDNSNFSSTDPRMIGLVTKTMIGDWLWKNTRRAVGGGISDNKHQRYFWIHPYTRTLYWSNKSPGLDENHAKAKSAFIENINVVPNHPSKSENLPNFSLLIQTPHRQLRLTAPDLEQHNNWFEAISHLIARNTGSNIRPSSRNTTASSTGNSLLKKSSLRRLQDVFSQPSASTTSTKRTDLTHHDHDHDHDDPLEDVRMCCNGKHHVSKLERDQKNRRKYRKPSKRIPNKNS